MANGFPAPGGMRYAPILAAVIFGIGAYLAVSSMRAPPSAPAPAGAALSGAGGLAMATCTGKLAETPDTEFTIPLDQCDKAIDAIEVKSGFLQKWTVCGGAKSFEISLNPRAVKVTSDAFHCSKTPTEVSVTFIGPAKK